MNIRARKVFKYEIINILRNKWIFVYALIIFSLTVSLIKIGGDFQKAVLSMASITVVLIPLISSLFTTLFWYYNEKFTQIMLTEPLPRKTLFWVKYLALSVSLSLCFVIGVTFGFLVFGTFSMNILILELIGILLTSIFVSVSLWISIKVADRMKGVGIVFGFWLYLVLIHDGVVLMMLLLLKDYPMDLPGGIIGVTSPIGLSRVILLMHNEASLLLGHTGALVRNILTSWQGYLMALGFSFVWLIAPLAFGQRAFQKKDF